MMASVVVMMLGHHGQALSRTPTSLRTLASPFRPAWTDGLSFTPPANNPVATHHESTLWNAAMAEGHAWYDDDNVSGTTTSSSTCTSRQRWQNDGFDLESHVEIFFICPDFRIPNFCPAIHRAMSKPTSATRCVGPKR